MRVSKTKLTPMLGRIYYDTYTESLFHVDVAHQGTSTDPFIIKTSGINTYDDLCYQNETNSQKIINIIFNSEPSNANNLLGSFYFKLYNDEDMELSSTPIQASFVNTQTSFPINMIIKMILKKENDIYSAILCL